MGHREGHRDTTGRANILPCASPSPQGSSEDTPGATRGAKERWARQSTEAARHSLRAAPTSTPAPRSASVAPPLSRKCGSTSSPFALLQHLDYLSPRETAAGRLHPPQRSHRPLASFRTHRKLRVRASHMRRRRAVTPDSSGRQPGSNSPTQEQVPSPHDRPTQN